MWFPQKGTKSGEILLNTELLAPGESPEGYLGDGQIAPLSDRDGKGRRLAGDVQVISISYRLAKVFSGKFFHL